LSDPTARGRARVLLLINDLARAGAETQLVELALGLDTERYEVEIVLLKWINDFEERLRTGGIRVTALRRRGSWDLRVLPRLSCALERLQPDVLHAHLFLGNLHGVVMGRLSGIPVVIASQRTSYEASLRPLLRRLARRVHSYADRVIVNARASLEEERAAGVPADRLVYIPNGVPLPSAAPASRAELGLAEGPLVVAVGQLTSDKGHHHLIEAWPEVQRAHPGASLLILGEGPLRESLESRVRALGVAAGVRLPGFRPGVGGVLAACDVFVQPSVNEGMPNALLEAMAAGRPVVASRIGGIPDVVDAVSGALVPPGDPPALARAISALLSDPERRRVAGAAASQRVRQEFSVERMVERTERLYAALLARNRPSRGPG
jgi:glycosyltransferase involved in cell wall biosynthesis